MQCEFFSSSSSSSSFSHMLCLGLIWQCESFGDESYFADSEPPPPKYETMERMASAQLYFFFFFFFFLFFSPPPTPSSLAPFHRPRIPLSSFASRLGNFWRRTHHTHAAAVDDQESGDDEESRYAVKHLANRKMTWWEGGRPPIVKPRPRRNRLPPLICFLPVALIIPLGLLFLFDLITNSASNTSSSSQEQSQELATSPAIGVIIIDSEREGDPGRSSLFLKVSSGDDAFVANQQQQQQQQVTLPDPLDTYTSAACQTYFDSKFAAARVTELS